mgnify:CR=1 FL=1
MPIGPVCPAMILAADVWRAVRRPSCHTVIYQMHPPKLELEQTTPSPPIFAKPPPPNPFPLPPPSPFPLPPSPSPRTRTPLPPSPAHTHTRAHQT